ncbi:MAG: replicative DNA helicase [Deltaproteobacteria bacterium]|jgi:replicative DNA helicase|nr:replicative DNA helicase [Deltaproteobacteria bacterium]
MTGPIEDSNHNPSLSKPDLDVERSLLGAILADVFEALPLTMEAKLAPTDFFHAPHGEIYKMIISLYDSGKPVDVTSVNDGLRTKGVLASVGGASYVAELWDHFGVPGHVGYYAKLIIDRAMLRTILNITQDISLKCRSNPPSVVDVLDEAEAAIYKVRDDRSSSRLVAISTQMTSFFDKITDLRLHKGGITGQPTGYAHLDRLTGGFQKTDLIILGGRPGMGKTSLALNLAINVAIPSQREDKKDLPASPVVIFSLEMGTEQVLQRLLCQIGQHNLLELRTGRISDEEIGKLTSTASLLRNSPIFIDDTAAIRPLELRAKTRRLQSQLRNQGQQLGLVVVDYLQLMRPNGKHNNREQEISEISGSLKSLAKELDVPVLTLSQLKRADASEPSLSDLRESGAIEQDADIVFFVLRRELLKQDNPDLKGQAELQLKKHRNGPTGVVYMHFKQHCTSFLPATNFHPISS